MDIYPKTAMDNFLAEPVRYSTTPCASLEERLHQRMPPLERLYPGFLPYTT